MEENNTFILTSVRPFCELVLSRDGRERRLMRGGGPPPAPPTPPESSTEPRLLRRLLRLAVPGLLDCDLATVKIRGERSELVETRTVELIDITNT